MLVLLLAPQGAAAVALDVEAALEDVVYRLGFGSRAELAAAASWVTETELYQWADEAAKRLAYRAGVFITVDTSITVTPSTAAYNLQANHVFTLAAALGGTPLRITSVRDLWALDGSWPATSGPAQRCSLDAGAVGTITLYPKPTAGGTLEQICQEYPGTVEAGSSELALPTVLQDYFSYAMLAGARGKESEAAMPEMAAHFAQRVAMYEQVIEHLWGPGQ